MEEMDDELLCEQCELGLDCCLEVSEALAIANDGSRNYSLSRVEANVGHDAGRSDLGDG